MDSEVAEQYGALQPRMARMAPQFARIIVATVLCGFCAVSALSVLRTTRSFWLVALAIVCVATLLALQLAYFSQPTKSARKPLTYAALILQACLVYLPLFLLGQSWIGLPGFLAGSVLLVLPRAEAAALFLAIVLSVGWIEGAQTGSVYDVVYIVVSTMITGLVVYGLTRLAAVVTELHEARAELAKAAVARERLRFARDLHDLLGLSLSAITLKSELTNRLITKQPTRAREELEEILSISRQALGDVRSVASGYRELSLDDESRQARSVLAAANVEVSFERCGPQVPPKIGTTLATVLREGVTNVLRHSKAEHCRISVVATSDRVDLEVVNDGVFEGAVSNGVVPFDGSGLHNLSERVGQLGGELSAGPTGTGTFRLQATVPLGPSAGGS